jgi:pimeloyl-ACP methyl ester carboxylesterase
MSHSVERNFTVNGYELTAKEWQPGGSIKVLALHGWLDNAASFDVLAPLLVDCHVIALDLPGQGLSAHKSPQASYNIWDDLLDILAVADALEWPRFHLLGHSRGAIISMLLGATSADRVQSMLLLDGIWPMSVKIEDSAKQLASFIQQNRTLSEKKLPSYRSIEAAIKARCKSARMSELAARPIVERGLEHRGDRYCWTSDPRLTTASAFKFSVGHIESLVKAITIPCMLLLAEQGMGGHKEVLEQVSALPTVDCQSLPGSHHFHMESEAAEIAAIALGFFSGG